MSCLLLFLKKIKFKEFICFFLFIYLYFFDVAPDQDRWILSFDLEKVICLILILIGLFSSSICSILILCCSFGSWSADWLSPILICLDQDWIFCFVSGRRLIRFKTRNEPGDNSWSWLSFNLALCFYCSWSSWSWISKGIVCRTAPAKGSGSLFQGCHLISFWQCFLFWTEIPITILIILERS